VNKRKVFTWGLVIVAVFIWGFLGLGLIGPKTLEDQDFPQSFRNTNLETLVSGDEAKKQISEMHRTKVPISQGFIAMYKAPDKEITLWISESPNFIFADRLFVVMDEKMPKSEVFKNRKEISVNGEKVICVTGMGMEHYYWYKAKRVYWIAVMGDKGEEVVKEVMQKF
jgi:hypothetical protein